MEQYYFCEELPLALEYGMSLHEFWDEPEDLFFAYQKAYVNKVHNNAYVQALYNHLAFSNVVANALRGKNEPYIEFPKECVYNPFEDSKKQYKNKNNKSYISQIDTSKNNNGLYQIKRMIEERMKEKDG